MSKPAVKAIPEGMHSLTPHLVCADAAAAIEFYKRAFHATDVSICLLYTSPSPRDVEESRMPSSA